MLTYFTIPEDYGNLSKSELKEIFQGVSFVFKNWALNTPCDFEVPVQKPDPLPFEFSFRFFGRFSGILTIQTTPDMARGLLGAGKDASARHFSEEETFKEFAAVFSGRLMAHLWGSDWGLFVAEAPVFSPPGNWSDSKTVACCAFVIENWPIEVRVLTEKPVVKNPVIQLAKAQSSLQEKKNA